MVSGFTFGITFSTVPFSSIIKVERTTPMLMFAVIETGGKQYKVQYGDVIFVEKLDAEENSTVDFPVVAVFGEGEPKVGTPYVQGTRARPRAASKSACRPLSR